jgi:hypothetical protein
VQEVLALAYAGGTLELLTAMSPPGVPCCATVQVLKRGANGRFSSPQTLVANADGGTIGRLIPLADGRLLAVIAAPGGLWVTEARGAGPFAPVRALTPPGVQPVALAASAAGGGGSAVAWTQGSSQTVFAAIARPRATPSRVRRLVVVPAGHSIDGLQLVPGAAAGFTVAWTESWSDAAGVYHSRAMAGDPERGTGGPVRGRALSGAGGVASALGVAGDGRGDEVALWDVCASDACVVRGSARRAGRWFGAPASLGAIDAGQSPVVTMAPDGSGLSGWIAGGRAVLAGLTGGARLGFGAPRAISGGLAANLDVAQGQGGEAVATWTQGTAAPHVFASLSR